MVDGGARSTARIPVSLALTVVTTAGALSAQLMATTTIQNQKRDAIAVCAKPANGKGKVLMPCKCITQVDEKLKPLGCALDLAFSLDKETLSLSPAKVHIATRRIDGKRKKPTTLTAAFCPFCGVKITKEGP